MAVLASPSNSGGKTAPHAEAANSKPTQQPVFHVVIFLLLSGFCLFSLVNDIAGEMVHPVITIGFTQRKSLFFS